MADPGIFGFATPPKKSQPFGALPPYTYKPKKKKAKQLTARQLLIAMMAQKADKETSFGARLKGVGKGALGGATWAMTQIMRPSWGVVSGTQAALRGAGVEGIGRAVAKGVKGENRIGFGQVLGEHGVLKGHRRLRGAAGFGLDVITDPLMLLSMAAAPVTGGASLAAYTAAKQGGKAIGMATLKQAAREAGEEALKGSTDEIVGHALKAGGKGFENRLQLFEHNKKVQEFSANMLGHTEAQRAALLTERHIAQSMARAEAKVFNPKKLAFTLGTPKHKLVLRTPVPLLSRPGARLSQKGIPVVSQLSDSLGRAFVPGFKNEIYQAGKLARQHAAEQNAVVAKQMISHIMGKVDSELDDKDMLEALHLFEQPLKTTRGGTWKAVVKDKQTGVYRLNRPYMELLLRKGHITPQQADFVNRFQLASEKLIQMDKAAGVQVEHFGKTGRLYVPHVVKRSTQDAMGLPTVAQHGLLTKAGFQHHREGTYLSLKQIKELVEKGELPKDVETNPLALLARRSRAGAERQADMALINTVKASVGVPTRLVNPKSVARAEVRLKAANEAYEAAVRGSAHAEKQYADAIDNVRATLTEEFTKNDKALSRHITNSKKNVKARKISALEAAAKKTRSKAKKEAYAQQIAKLKRASVSSPAIVKLQKKQMELRRDYEHAIDALNRPRTKAHNNALGEERLAFLTAQSAKDDAFKQIRAAEKSLKKARRGRRNPAAHPGLVPTTAQDTLDEWGNKMLFPKESADALFRLERLVSGNDQTVENFTRSLSKWMGGWKILVTVANPLGYRFRNTMTDFWNMWLARVPAHQIGVQGNRAAHLLRDYKTGLDAMASGTGITGPQIRAMYVMKEAGDHGILSGLFAGDIYNVARAMKYEGSKRALLHDKKFIALYIKVAADFNKNAENWGRLTHYLYRRDVLKESAAEAAFKVKQAHFDYEDLTEFEQKVMKNIFPFYTWTRKNIPYQVKQIAAEPGRYSAFPKLAQEMAYIANEDPNTPVPDYVASGFGIPLGGANYYMPQFGVSDLTPLQGPGQAWQRGVSMVNPALKIPAEIATGKSLFSGADISPENHPRVPVTGLGETVAGLLPFGLGNAGTTERAGVKGPGANPWFAYAASQLGPLGSTALVRGGGLRQKGHVNTGLLSTGTGISVAHADPKQTVYFKQQEIIKEVDKILAGLRDAGYLKRKKRKASDFDKLIDSILRGNYGG